MAKEDIAIVGETGKNVMKKCKQPKFVIPGHDDWSNTGSVKHTFKMAQQLKKKNYR